MEVREAMDRAREDEVRQFKDAVDQRVQELNSYLQSFKEELVRRGNSHVTLNFITSIYLFHLK